MHIYKRREIDFQHTDERGSLVQLVHTGFEQVNVLTTVGGATRGAHFHRRSVEAFYVISGSVEVSLRGREIRETVMFHRGDFFEIEPDVLHDMFFPEDCLMVQMYNVPVENADGTKDIYSEDEFDA